MKKSSEIQQELKQLGVNLTAGFEPIQEIPEGYFQTFSNELKDRIKEDEFLSTLPKESPYQVPTGYFSDFSSELQHEIFLSSLPKSLPYEVPDTYFSELSTEISRKLPISAPSLKPLILTRKWVIKFSMAASILLFVGIAFKTIIAPVQANQVASNLETQLSTVSDDEIQQYLLLHQNEVDANLAIESVDENNFDLNKLESEVLENTMNSISDEELSKYAL